MALLAPTTAGIPQRGIVLASHLKEVELARIEAQGMALMRRYLDALGGSSEGVDLEELRGLLRQNAVTKSYVNTYGSSHSLL